MLGTRGILVVSALAALLVGCGDSGTDDNNNDNGNGNQNNNNNSVRPVCGNGTIEGAEECDDGVNNSDSQPNACRTTCTAARCGDQVVDDETTPAEECDEGADNSDTEPDTCRSDCMLPSCGDGVVDTERGEQCDEGPANSNAPNAACRTNCVTGGCGDGILDSGEECDDGDQNSNTTVDACRRSCLEAYCGDNVVDTGEVCDDGDNQGGDGCSADCLSDETCGNNIVDPDEECDSGNDLSNAPNATCRPGCVNRRCGDGIIDGTFGEVCDLGGLNAETPNAACRTNCLPKRCGDGVKDATEICDDGDNQSGDGCSADCLSVETCGNGYTDVAVGEECDNGTDLSSDPNAACRPGCLLRRCGDGIIDDLYDETCDDGTTLSNEPDAACRTNCLQRRCGDEIVDPGFDEECDNGTNNNDEDPNACRLNCKNPHCGDHVIDDLSGEQCDDGQTNSDDPNEPCRTNCLPRRCGDGIIDNLHSEECDDATQNSNTAANACRTNCLLPHCGDGVIDQGEDCEGTNLNGLTCQDYNYSNPGGLTCHATWCYAVTSNCSNDCGDGKREPGEQCDDGDNDDGDGCSSTCTIERPNWVCSGGYQELSVCTCAQYWVGTTCDDRCVVYADVDQTALADGESWGTAYANLQTAINQANGAGPGCEVWVSDGLYEVWNTGTSDTLNLADDVAIYGGFDGTETDRIQRDWTTNHAIITGKDPSSTSKVFHVVTASRVTNTRLDGLHITDGDAGSDYGAGIDLYVSDLVMANCELYGHAAKNGACINTNNSTLTITGSTLRDSTTSNYGAGIYLSATPTVIEDSRFMRLHGKYGGAIAGYSNTLDITRTEFHSNKATGYNSGGAIGLNVPAATFTDCIFADNVSTSVNAGAIDIITGNLTITGSLFTNNRAPGGGRDGGALEVSSGATATIERTIFAGNYGYDDGGAIIDQGTTSVVDSVFAGNLAGGSGSAVYSESVNTAFTNCTFAGNDGYGTIYAYNTAVPTVTNSVLWGNTYGIQPTSGVTVSHCVIQGGYAGMNNVDSDPSYAGNPLYTGDWLTSVYDSVTGRTVYTANTVPWGSTEDLAGTFVAVDTTDARWFYIESNTADSVTVVGDPTATFDVGDVFTIHDLRPTAASTACIDMADDTASGRLSVDLYGVTWADYWEGVTDIGTPGTVTDIGAYEFTTP